MSVCCRALQDAQDIFGVDFDFEEFEQYGDDYDEGEEEDEYGDEDMDDDGEARPRPAKKAKKGKRATIYDVFEPSDLARAHYTDKDHEIRSADMPERFQLRQVAVSPAEDGELEEEANWIYKWAFTTAPGKCCYNATFITACPGPSIALQVQNVHIVVSRQDYWEQADTAASTSSRGSTTTPSRKPTSAIPKIKVALKYMRNQQFEVKIVW